MFEVEVKWGYNAVHAVDVSTTRKWVVSEEKKFDTGEGIHEGGVTYRFFSPTNKDISPVVENNSFLTGTQCIRRPKLQHHPKQKVPVEETSAAE